MTNSDKKLVVKKYHCPVCKKSHSISFDPHFADNRPRYPFTYVFMHKYENPTKLEDQEKEILTTLYIDAHLDIRGVEAVMTEDNTNIVSKEIMVEMVNKLTKVILEMQAEIDEIQANYNSLKEKCAQFLEK
ncbi:MAG: hypothetical protein ACTSWC_09285 [Promethearchaeota archaeon]